MFLLEIHTALAAPSTSETDEYHASLAIAHTRPQPVSNQAFY